jgi:hypothetical protein
MPAENRIYHSLTIAIARGGTDRARALLKIRKALLANSGMVERSAEALGCARRSLVRWLGAHPELQAYAAELRAEAGISGPRKPRTRKRTKS